MSDSPLPSPETRTPFEIAIDFILPHEEAFARGHWGNELFVVTENVSGDSGGLTKYGIDQASHPGVDIANLTRDGAIAIYRAEWDRHQFDLLPGKLAICAMDVDVNGGNWRLWLQEAYNATHDDKLLLDGVVGPQTIADLMKSADQAAMVEQFIEERNNHFDALAQAHPVDQKFLHGWLDRDVDLTVLLHSLPDDFGMASEAQ